MRPEDGPREHIQIFSHYRIRQARREDTASNQIEHLSRKPDYLRTAEKITLVSITTRIIARSSACERAWRRRFHGR